MTSRSPQPSSLLPVLLSVIIVNWNSKDYLQKCLRSIERHCQRRDLEIIVVDGASYDGCGEMLAAEFPSVIFVQSTENIGFARANNLGAHSAKGDFLLLLNPDTEFIEDSISTMLDALNILPDAGAIGCRLLNADRSIQTTSILTFPTILNRTLDSEFLRRSFPTLWGMGPLFSGKTEPAQVEAVSGACILVRRELFEKVGGFTESYFMYCEDVDLCFKLQSTGLKNYHLPTTTIVHFGGGSSSHSVSNFSTIMMRESWYQFLRTNRGLGIALSYRFCMLLSALSRMLCIGPLLLFGNRVIRHGPRSWCKWFAVLRWSLGLESAKRSS